MDLKEWGTLPRWVGLPVIVHIIYIMGLMGSSKLIDNRVCNEGEGGGGVWSHIPPPFLHNNPASQTSAIPEFPECRFLSQYRITCQDFGESHVTSRGAVKSRIPSINLRFLESRSIHFGSNARSRKYPLYPQLTSACSAPVC